MDQEKKEEEISDADKFKVYLYEVADLIPDDGVTADSLFNIFNPYSSYWKGKDNAFDQFITKYGFYSGIADGDVISQINALWPFDSDSETGTDTDDNYPSSDDKAKLKAVAPIPEADEDTKPGTRSSACVSSSSEEGTAVIVNPALVKPVPLQPRGVTWAMPLTSSKTGNPASPVESPLRSAFKRYASTKEGATHAQAVIPEAAVIPEQAGIHSGNADRSDSESPKSPPSHDALVFQTSDSVDGEEYKEESAESIEGRANQLINDSLINDESKAKIISVCQQSGYRHLEVTLLEHIQTFLEEKKLNVDDLITELRKGKAKSAVFETHVGSFTCSKELLYNMEKETTLKTRVTFHLAGIDSEILSSLLKEIIPEYSDLNILEL